MKLRTVGVICPDCGDPMSYVGKLSWSDAWLGYTRQAWCNCDTVRSFESRSWLLLYNERKIFVGIVPGTFVFLVSAGNRIHEHPGGDIPF